MELYSGAKEEIKRSADIVELIGQYVQLKKAGKNHVGLCPFHGEKDPSFTVSQPKQMFHCFGCKKGGDIFAFWMEYHNVTFSQAIKDLSEKYNVSLPERELTPSQREKIELKEYLYKINETAAGYYSGILNKTAKGLAGREYLAKRSLGKDVIEKFMLGYAPPEWDGLVRYLKSKRIDPDKAVEAGLIIPKKIKGYYDRFRGRLIFPIHNIKKQIAGFGGRVLDDSLPKYLNTPETPIFHKGNLLYGIHEAFQFIRESGRTVIVEGYTDVLALKNHGFNEAVGTLGTALTDDHIRRLKGYAKEAIVVFDSDTAGKGAAIKSLPLFINEGLASRVIVLPEGDDPDSFINRKGLNSFIKLLDESVPLFEFYIDLKVGLINKGVEGQVEFLQEILPVLNSLNSDTQRALYLGLLSERTGVPETIVRKELQNLRVSDPGNGYKSQLKEKLDGARAKSSHDLHLLNLLIHFPATAGRLLENECMLLLSAPDVIEIFNTVLKVYKEVGEIVPSEILEKLDGESVKERFREALLAPPFYPEEAIEQALKEFEERVKRIKLSQSLMKTGETLEDKNRLLILKRERHA